MEFDDKVRSKMGLSVCLRDMGNKTSRIFFDDIKSNELENPIDWKFDCFYTFTSEFENGILDEMKLSDQQFQQIGEAVVARLLSLNDRIK